MDFPTNWCVYTLPLDILGYHITILFRSSLVTDLMSIIDSNIQMRYTSQAVDPRSTLMSRRSIKILNEVLKEFSNYKMLAGVRTMGNVCDYCYNGRYWVLGTHERTAGWLSSPTFIWLLRETVVNVCIHFESHHNQSATNSRRPTTRPPGL